MARPLRLEFPGAVYHITSRGNERKVIFRSDADRELFLGVMESTIGRFAWLCHAFVLMGNHYHLLIETPKPNLSRGMRQLNGVYTQEFNRVHRRVGHLFQGRFKAIVVEKDEYLLQLSRYLALNPVRAGMVKRPEDWRWSSYGATAGLTGVPSWLTVSWLRAQFGKDEISAVAAFRNYVCGGTEAGFPFAALTGQLLLGTKKFVEKMERLVDRKSGAVEIPRKQRHAAKPGLDEIFQKGVRSGEVEGETIYRAHTEFGYTQREIGEYLGKHYATVSRAIARQENLHKEK